MARLLIHVEGQTEESFVNEVLAPHLYRCGYLDVSARLMGNARARDHRGGVRGWPVVKEDVLKHLKEDRDRLVSLMVDYYAMPSKGAKRWPGRDQAPGRPYAERAPLVEQALTTDIETELRDPRSANRFLPCVVMHEFEGLLFSDCHRFAQAIQRPELEADLLKIRHAFGTPEEINDSPLTAPSKRVEALVPGYEKPLLGVLAALEIGLEVMRRECPHFDSWLRRLESFGTRQV